MWKDAQSLVVAEGDTPAEGLLEILDHLHRYRIDHLLMEPRIRLVRIEASLHQHGRVVQIDGRVIAVV